MISKLFRREDLSINSDGSYLIRYVLWKSKSGRALYLHKVVGDDWSRDPHDHPRDFVSIGLWGSYDEELFTQKWNGGNPKYFHTETRRFRAPWFRSFPAGGTFVHRLVSTGKPVWTLVYTGPERGRTWGFYTDTGFVPADQYFAEHRSGRS